MKSSFRDQVSEEINSGKIPEEIGKPLLQVYSSYQNALKGSGHDFSALDAMLGKMMEIVIEQRNNPFVFPPYHERITAPFNYHLFGLDFFRPLIEVEKSTILGEKSLDAIEKHLARGENVVLLANHQTEPDPQAIQLMIEKTHPKLGEEMIFVAGHRVTTDPFCIPFSMGLNLLCIYSKNYIEHPPELKKEKVAHNQKTMKKMRDLLAEGRKCIYVAPSGGRDRPNAEGKVEVKPFDAKSIEMFWFTGNHSGVTTHFYPLALSTTNLFPPPSEIRVELGEQRIAARTPIHIAFGEEIDMVNFPGSHTEDKKERRQCRADYIWGLVKDLYGKISS